MAVDDIKDGVGVGVVHFPVLPVIFKNGPDGILSSEIPDLKL